MEEQKPKTKKTIHRFFHSNTGAKLNIWATSEDEAVLIFGSLVENVIQWTYRKRKANVGKSLKAYRSTEKKAKNGSSMH